jgi:hypothetical protein
MARRAPCLDEAPSHRRSVLLGARASRPPRWQDLRPPSPPRASSSIRAAAPATTPLEESAVQRAGVPASLGTPTIPWRRRAAR